MLSKRCFSGLVCVALLIVAMTVGCGGKSDGVNLAEEITKAKSVKDPKARAIALVRVAEKLRAAGDAAGADAAISQASATCDSIADAAGRAEGQIAVAEALAKAARSGESGDLLKKARQASDEIGDKIQKVHVVARLAEVYGVQLDKQSTAVGYLSGVENTAQEIENPEFRIQAMAEIAYTYQQVKAVAEAERQLNVTVQAARAIEDPFQRANSLLIVGGQLARLKKTSEAKNLFDEAQQVALTISDPSQQANALLKLAKSLAAANQKGAAQDALAKADSAANKIEAQDMKLLLRTEINSQREKL